MTKDTTAKAAELQDKALDDAQGGADLNLAMATKFSATTASADALAIEEELMALRKRPTRIEKDLLGGVEEVAVLRKRPGR